MSGFLHSFTRKGPPARRTGVRAALALLYLLLGISAAWHAPHSFRKDPVLASSHAGPTPVAALGDACALCAWQSLSQESAAAPVPRVSVSRISAAPLRLAAAPARGFFLAFRARGPPVLS